MAETSYSVPLHIRLLRAILRPIFRGLYHLLSRVRISGLENIPQSGAYLIAINHVSIFDAPLVLAFWPTMPEAAGAVEIWDRPVQKYLVRLYGGIPVHRGEFDRKLIENVRNVLHSGRSLLIAPEGGRSHSLSMRRALPGVAYLADEAQVPIVPVGIVGATDDFFSQGLKGKRPTIEMHIGAAFRLPPVTGKGEARRLARQSNADAIMLRIAMLLPAEYHGVYAAGVFTGSALTGTESPGIPQPSSGKPVLEEGLANGEAKSAAQASR